MTNIFLWFNPNYFRIIFFSFKKKIQIEKNSENIKLKIAEIQMTFLTFWSFDFLRKRGLKHKNLKKFVLNEKSQKKLQKFGVCRTFYSSDFFHELLFSSASFFFDVFCRVKFPRYVIGELLSRFVALILTFISSFSLIFVFYFVLQMQWCF